MAAPAITFELDFDAIKIKFGGVLHFRLVRSKLLSIQAWRQGDKNFSIEYTMVGGAALCEYDDEEKWKTILAGLDDVL